MDFNSYKSEKYYKVEMNNGSGSFPDEYETYESAYDAMCRNYVREINDGYKPTLYSIKEYSETWYKENGEEHHNTMIRPVWS